MHSSLVQYSLACTVHASKINTENKIAELISFSNGFSVVLSWNWIFRNNPEFNFNSIYLATRLYTEGNKLRKEWKQCRKVVPWNRMALTSLVLPILYKLDDTLSFYDKAVYFTVTEKKIFGKNKTRKIKVQGKWDSQYYIV